MEGRTETMGYRLRSCVDLSEVHYSNSQPFTFHAVRSLERKEYMEHETWLYYLNLPRPDPAVDQ